MDFVGKKEFHKGGEYDGKGTWIWINMAAECRLVLISLVGERSQKSADRLAKRTAQYLEALSLFATDGLKFCKISF